MLCLIGFGLYSLRVPLNRIPLAKNTRSLQCDQSEILSILNTVNKEAVREGKIRTHYNIETQKLRGNNLSLV